MILIADSGSTKCDWVILSPESDAQIVHTIGLNPYFHSSEFIAKTILEHLRLNEISENVKQVFFYGAGNSSNDLKQIVTSGLQAAFPSADINADHDLVGAAYSTYSGEKCITAILGTGSNSCMFDGTNVFEEVPALAYILGDEGSGSYFGKKILSDFLYKRLPSEMHEYLKNEYQITKDKIMEAVYMKPHANVYLASFVKTLSPFKQLPYVQELLLEGMKRFLDIHVCCFENYQNIPTHFIGSVGFYFENELRKAAEIMQVKVGKIVQQPIYGLVNYHLKYLISNPTLYKPLPIL